MDKYHPILALATLLTSLPLKGITQLGQSLVTVAGREVASTFAGALTAAINVADADADEDVEGTNKREYTFRQGYSGCAVVVEYSPDAFDKKIKGIKHIRDLMGWGLRESKDWFTGAEEFFSPDAGDYHRRALLAFDVPQDYAAALIQEFRMLQNGENTGTISIELCQDVDGMVRPGQNTDPATGWSIKLRHNDLNRKIAFIKTLRQVLGCGLKPAKKIADKVFEIAKYDCLDHAELVIDNDLHYFGAVDTAAMVHFDNVGYPTTTAIVIPRRRADYYREVTHLSRIAPLVGCCDSAGALNLDG